MNNVWFVIPAREGSKGFPHKNRHLFDYTAKQIPDSLRSRTIVTTDDEQLISRADEYGFSALKRTSELSTDDTSMKFVIKDVIEKFNIAPEDDVVTLYLTYPQRTFSQIQEIYDFYSNMGVGSLLCRKHVDNHPYMCYYILDNCRGSKVVNHDLYRRQEYPDCFEVCHYVVITKSKILSSLDNNLFHEDTIFYPLNGEDLIIDVDYLNDFENFKKAD